MNGSLRDEPIAALLVGALRAHFTGLLEFLRSGSGPQSVVFRSGVPVRVELPDGDAPDRAAPPSDRLAHRRKAEQGLTRLFAERDLAFRAVEGLDDPVPGPALVLEPLPLLFRGFSAHLGSARPFLPPRETRLRLADTYPDGVDPFQFGAELEALVRAGLGVEALVAQGVARAKAEAAVACLVVTEMAFAEAAAGDLDSQPAAGPKSGGLGRAEGEGLVVHRRVPHRPEAGSARRELDPRPSRSSVPAPSVPDATGLLPAEAAPSVTQRLSPLLGRGYYQMLRVGPETDPAQLERAYRFLVNRLAEEPGDEGTAALAGLYREAFTFLGDRARAARYAAVSDGERAALEAEPRAERALLAVGDGRFEEARLLAAWASRLAPRRQELSTLLTAVTWLSALPEDRGPSPRAAVVVEARRTGHRLLWLALALVAAAEGDSKGARWAAAESGVPEHPLLARFGGG